VLGGVGVVVVVVVVVLEVGGGALLGGGVGGGVGGAVGAGGPGTTSPGAWFVSGRRFVGPLSPNGTGAFDPLST
jgi:hypothetical protein